MKKAEKNRLKKQILKLIRKKRNREAGLFMERYKSKYGDLNV